MNEKYDKYELYHGANDTNIIFIQFEDCDPNIHLNLHAFVARSANLLRLTERMKKKRLMKLHVCIIMKLHSNITHQNMLAKITST